MNRLLDLCSEFIRTDSTNARGNLDIANLVKGELTRLGFTVSLQKARLCGAPQANLIARIGSDRKKPLLINTHLDTVSTSPDQWTQTNGDPFNPMIKRGRLYGLGAADTKLALACQIVALEGLYLKKLRVPLMITGTYGEEMGLVGIQKLIGQKEISPRYVLNSEPTELQPCSGNYGFRIYKLVSKDRVTQRVTGYRHSLYFRGKAAHSAVPELGHNAITHAIAWLQLQKDSVFVLDAHGGIAPNIVAPDCMLEIISPYDQLKDLSGYGGQVVETFPIKTMDVYPILGKTLKHLPPSLLAMSRIKEKTNVGRIDFKKGKFEILFSQRFAPDVSPDRSLQMWRKACDHEGRAQILIEKHNPSFEQDPSKPFVREVQSVLRSMKKKKRLVLKPGCTEAMYFASLGCDVLTIGPGQSYGNIHAPNESIRIKDLEEAVEFYRRVVEQICF